MRRYFSNILLIVLSVFFFSTQAVSAASGGGEDFDPRQMILHHVGDDYSWHITTIGEQHVSIPLPVILYSESKGFHVFLSSAFLHGNGSYQGFYITHEGQYAGKIVERTSGGEEVRPWDFSITKNAASLIITSCILLFLILKTASFYRGQGRGNYRSPKGLAGAMEILVMNIQDEVIKPCIGKNYQRFSPYLLTVFFFILLNNLIGLVPIFPGGANVTGNIAITMVLALFTFFFVNIFGTKEYWREVFWPDVPVWLKVIPIMPLIEVIGVFTKPFALTIRLFANILAGHSIVIGLTCLVFLTVKLGAAINTSMTTLYVIMAVFMGVVEILVSFIQAYVFTLLSAVFIGLAQAEPHHHEAKH